MKGRKIVDVRHMTKAEMEREGWDDYRGPATVLVLDNGTILYPSMDEEGNGPGALFGATKDGEAFYVFPEKEGSTP